MHIFRAGYIEECKSAYRIGRIPGRYFEFLVDFELGKEEKIFSQSHEFCRRQARTFMAPVRFGNGNAKCKVHSPH